jgi:hypothetical protein
MLVRPRNGARDLRSILGARTWINSITISPAAQNETLVAYKQPSIITHLSAFRQTLGARRTKPTVIPNEFALRHFDSARNPITVRVIRREVIPTPIGELHVVRLEMRVRDPGHYEGEGVIRIHLSDDPCRLPVRIESTMAVVGTAILTIRSEQTACQLH